MAATVTRNFGVVSKGYCTGDTPVGWAFGSENPALHSPRFGRVENAAAGDRNPVKVGETYG